MIDLTAVKNLYNNAIDDLLSSQGLAVPCNVVHEDPSGSGCPNCIVNPITGRSTSRYSQPTLAPDLEIKASGGVPEDMFVFYIDENSNYYSSSNQDIQMSGMTLFRAAFPSSLVFFLDVEHPLGFQNLYPSGFFDDGLTFSSRESIGKLLVRDSGNPASAENSYQILQDIISSGVSSTASGIFYNSNTAHILRDSSNSLVPNDIAATFSGLVSSFDGLSISVRNTDSIWQHEELLCGFAHNTCFNRTDAIDAFVDTHCDGRVLSSFRETYNTHCSGEDYFPVPVSEEAASGEYIWFPEGHICPVCNGVGSFPVTTTESKDIVVIFDNKKFINFGNVNVSQGDMQTITPITMYTTLTTADYILVDTSVTPYTQNKFTRVSEPQPVGLGENKYIFTNWQRSA